MAGCREAMPPRANRLDKPPGRWGGDDSELDVFAAERYFNGDDALWCARSSSSSLSSAFRTGTHEHDRSVVGTSSSEASWNSRSALLPDGKAVAAAAAEAEPYGTGGERRRGKPPPPSSHLRRWMLGVAGCACIGGGGDGEESSVSADDADCRDELEDGDIVGVGGQEELVTNEAVELFQGRQRNELAVREAIAVRVKPGRCLDDGDEFLAGKAAFSPVRLVAGDGPRRAGSSAQLSTPFLNLATAAASHDQLHNSSEQIRPLGDNGSKQFSAFTIAAGNTARGGGLHAAAGGIPTVPRGPCMSRRDWSDDDAAPSELGCAYPPSEASVVWSVVTAEGAASCNFSSAASGYCYYHHISGGEDDAGRCNRRRRRSGIASGGGLLTCMGDKAVDAVGAAAVGPRYGGRNGART